ncbi:MAG: protein-export chaperone SecB [Rhodobacteraceae bacterium]|nr:protein-export chaperone SecB [Paracoccaceae bacterium]
MAKNGAKEPQEAAEPTDTSAQQQPQMNVLGQFVRDLSFENVMAQKGTSGDVQPDVQVQVNLDAKKQPAQNQFEVSIKLNIKSKSKTSGDMLFVLEIDYVGIFMITGVPDNQIHPFLLIECPRMIFPFLRRIVSDTTRDGGYPPLNLEMIDFVKLYRQEIVRRQIAEAKTTETAES